MKIYTISELFPSLQGEGARAGTPVIFVRFAGCPLRCSYCDERARQNTVQEMTLPQILEAIDDLNIPRVVFTGGEPSLQLDAALVAAVKARGIHTSIETNGHHDVSGLGLDWITVSPKNREGGPIDPSDFRQRRGNELKVVFPDAFNDSLFFDTDLQFDHYFLQPCTEGDMKSFVTHSNVQRAIEFALQNPRWRISLQLHKIMGIK